MKYVSKAGLIGFLLGLLIIVSGPRRIIAPNLPARLNDASSGVYADLMEKLIREGHDQHYLRRIYAPDQNIFYQRLTRINIVQRERPEPYRRMYSQQAVQSIRDFLAVNEESFDTCEQKYGVDREVIAAILFVESRFGKVSGDNLVLYVLSSMALAPEDWNIKQLIENLDQELPDLSPEERAEKIAWIRRRARVKANWAYDELNTLLQLRHTHRIESERVKGSWAGAFGIPQFVPTSFEAYAVDGDENGTIDIYTVEDAIASVANYLYRNGWRGTITREKIRTVIWRYNHSRYYVNLIEDLAEAVSS